jgi:hypothetical protein
VYHPKRQKTRVVNLLKNHGKKREQSVAACVILSKAVGESGALSPDSSQWAGPQSLAAQGFQDIGKSKNVTKLKFIEIFLRLGLAIQSDLL